MSEIEIERREGSRSKGSRQINRAVARVRDKEAQARRTRLRTQRPNPTNQPTTPPPHRVVRAPVEQVEVVVVDEVGRVEDALLRLRHVARGLAARRRAHVARVQRRQVALVALRRRGRLLLERENAALLIATAARAQVEAGGEQLFVLLLGRRRAGLGVGRAGVLLGQAKVRHVEVEAGAAGDEAVNLCGFWMGRVLRGCRWLPLASLSLARAAPAPTPSHTPSPCCSCRGSACASRRCARCRSARAATARRRSSPRAARPRPRRPSCWLLVGCLLREREREREREIENGFQTGFAGKRVRERGSARAQLAL